MRILSKRGLKKEEGRERKRSEREREGKDCTFLFIYAEV